MLDYKQMYMNMIQASEKAVNILIEAQRQCEDIYMMECDEKDNIIKLPLNDNDNCWH